MKVPICQDTIVDNIAIANSSAEPTLVDSNRPTTSTFIPACFLPLIFETETLPEKKLRLDNTESLTRRERELLALFRVMAEPDRRLLLPTAEKLISAQVASGSKTP